MKPILPLILATILLFACTSETKENPYASALAPTASVTAYEIGDESTGKLHVSVSFLRDVDEQTFISILADLDNDGAFETEVTKNARPLVRAGYENRFAIEGDAQGNVPLAIWMRAGKQDTLNANEADVRIIATRTVANVDDSIAFSAPGSSEDLKRGFFSSVEAVEDGNYEREGDVPDLTGGPMDCFPIATANNLISLTNTNGGRDRLPASPQEMIDEMKQDMQFNNGVLIQNYQAGKQAFIDRHKLPITTERINRPTPEQLADALGSDCAVEVSTAAIQSKSGRDNAGHVMTGVGVSADGDDVRLLLHDPATKGAPGGDVYQLTQSEGTVLTVIKDYPFWDGIMYIDAIFVQCWDSEKAAQLGISPPQPSNVIAGPEEHGDYVIINTLVIGGKHYPISQFIRAGKDACPEEHWHAHQTVYSLEDPDHGITDPQPRACGFGPTKSVPTEHRSVHKDEATRWIGSVLSD